MEKTFIWALRIATYVFVTIVASIIILILSKGTQVLSWEFLTSFPKRGGTAGGIFPAILGTFYLIFGAIVVALPLGVATAIYITQYASNGKCIAALRCAISTLAGVPSIVFGLFGLGIFVIYCGFGASILSGSLTLGCMILPIVIVSSEEAIRTVPTNFKDGALALGATRWQSIRYAVIPYSIPGIITGLILSIGRVAGETAPILLTVAAFYLPKLPRSIFDQVMALSYHLYILATQHPDVDKVMPYQFATALVLLGIVVCANLLAILVRASFQKRFE